jgi:uncharacterized protein YigE (DUF2233 family)
MRRHREQGHESGEAEHRPLHHAAGRRSLVAERYGDDPVWAEQEPVDDEAFEEDEELAPAEEEEEEGDSLQGMLDGEIAADEGHGLDEEVGERHLHGRAGHGSPIPDLASMRDSDEEEDEDRTLQATASRLMPPDGPIRQPKKKKKKSLDKLLVGRGWRRVGLPGVRMKSVGSATIIAIDRSVKGTRLDTTPVGKKGTFSLPSQARSQRAEIALNGDLFNFGSGKPSGLHRRHDRNRRGTRQESGMGMFAFGQGKVGILNGGNRLPGWADNVVSGRPVIVRNGRAVTRYVPADRGRLTGRSGRSAVGLSKSGRILYLAAGTSMTAASMARLLARHDVDDALALDGSGSAQMYVKGKGMVKPGDRRRIGNAILVHTR